MWIAYLVAPAAGWGLFAGVPLRPVAAVSLVAVCLAAWGGRLGRWTIPAVLVALKLSAGCWVLVERGLAATYYANGTAAPPIERSTEFRAARFTRIDPAIDFGPAADRDLPLFFFNDLLRFNYYHPAEPNRAALAWSASWSGHLFVPEERVETLVLRGQGLRATIATDGFVVATLAPESLEARGTVRLPRGWRALAATAAAAYGAERRFFAGRLDASGRAIPFSADNIFVDRPREWRISLARIVRYASIAVDALILVWLAAASAGTIVSRVATSPARAVAACLMLAAVVDALRFALPWSNRLMLLPGGDDPLTYETYAREILLHGPLMTFGRPLGTGEAFYYQPLYPYVLAALHGVLGEDLWGIFFVQRLMFACTAAFVWQTTRSMFGERIGAVGLGLAAIVLYGPGARLSGTLLGEIVFLPLVCLWTWQLTTFNDAGRGRGAAWRTGAVGGLATLARSTLLLAWPFAVLALAIARRRAAQSLVPVGTMVIAGGLVVSLATLRNWVVAHQLVLVSTSLGINFYLGNQLPPGLQVSALVQAEHSLLRWVSDERVRATLEFARAAPGPFARNLLNKALYALGFFGAFVPGDRTAPFFVALWLAASAGVVAVWRAGVSLGRRGWPRTIPAIIAATHLASIVLIFPHHLRLILPFYVLLVPYAAALTAAVPWFRRGN